mmetsp:Transcript_7785/g.11500  ORF Transcript_7785/g.11500 Transcript_7785/m.11500 type:complete len:141 (-) Transcript_7785:354-776(-)|eukprot:CAMPEP_0196801080 /NCGR_PEP_ID=MMETSP1362-20130617/722_1 /TAXON_ID=163516 /ORGANISM="Leptocylindrus danicus, Strain CCMP1856" /LENGTH=140 /DNA_ID=CAMNT_0042171799 /DNA_START=73 /DNA_END=495 /DNA_ORIENTATION=+
MDGLPPGITAANLSQDDIPEGFSAADPTGDGGSGPGMSKSQQQDAKIAAVLDQCMTPEARQRLTRIKLVKPDKAAAVEKLIASMAMQGKLPGKVNEGKLIEMLEGLGAQMSKQSASKITINRKKYAFDSDDDDDNDDDLM